MTFDSSPIPVAKLTVPENTITYYNALCLSHQILHKHCFQFLFRGHFNSQEKLKSMLMKHFGVTNKEHYGMLWYFWSGQLSLYSACSSRGKITFGRWGSRFRWRLRSPSHLNQLFCYLHDLWIEFSACLEPRLLKRRTTVVLSDLASRNYTGFEPINLSRT